MRGRLFCRCQKHSGTESSTIHLTVSSVVGLAVQLGALGAALLARVGVPPLPIGVWR
jgi:hypothetical protein